MVIKWSAIYFKGSGMETLMFQLSPEASFAPRVLSLPVYTPVCVRVSVHPCVNPEHVRAITCETLKPGLPNSDHWCKTPSLFFYSSFILFYFIYLFIYLLGVGVGWKWGWMPLIFKAKFNFKSQFTTFWACPHHNASPIPARITKLGSDV